MALTLKQLQDKMVPASAKAGRDIDTQYLPPSKPDKKFVKDTFGDISYLDKKDLNKDSDAFTVQDKIKKNTKAPMMPGTNVTEANEPVAASTDGYAVYEAYEEEALDLLEEIMDLVEKDESTGYYWKDVAQNLKYARDCLLNNVVREDLNENFKVGSFKLKDGSKVTLEKNDVKILNDAIAGTKSHEKMLSTATKNKHEFNQFLQFAKSLNEDYDLAIESLLSEASLEQLEQIAKEDLAEGETWEFIKGGAKAGSTLGKHVGSTVGYVGGGLYGGTAAAGLAGAAKLVKTAKTIRNKRKGISAAHEPAKPYNPDDAKVSPGESRKNPLKEGVVTVARITPNNKKKSIVGTAAPAMDSDPNEKKNLEESKGIHKFKLPKKGSLKDLINKSYKREEKEREDFEIKHDQVGNAKVKKDLKESGGLGGHPSNYRNPAEGSLKFGKTEPSRDLKTYLISNNKANIMGDLAKKVGDIINVKSDRNMSHKMKVLEINGDKLKVKPINEELDKEKKNNLHEISNKTLKSYIDQAEDDEMVSSLTGKTDRPHGKNNKTFKNASQLKKHIDKRERGISAAERALDRNKSIGDLYKRLNIKKD